MEGNFYAHCNFAGTLSNRTGSCRGLLTTRHDDDRRGPNFIKEPQVSSCRDEGFDEPCSTLFESMPTIAKTRVNAPTTEEENYAQRSTIHDNDQRFLPVESYATNVRDNRPTFCGLHSLWRNPWV